MKVSEVKKLLRKNGCCMVRQGSRHEIWISPMTGKKFQVPRHASQEVATGTLDSIKESAGID
ncbi:type II toxin-antitoxin system HicA family toxin [Oscillospiraceae bacterium 50-58]